MYVDPVAAKRNRWKKVQCGDATNQGVSREIFIVLSQDGKRKATLKVKPLAQSTQENSLRSIIAFFVKL